ncbi:MAG TPA: NAD(P)-binding protein, partial [Pseudoxanthomonas sp.]|nr:NAD(P)-binding protein [Pseudoxanthomonas sp.]
MRARGALPVKDKRKDVAVIGYGTAGQALALLLARDGHRVQVFEQAAQLGPVG